MQHLGQFLNGYGELRTEFLQPARYPYGPSGVPEVPFDLPDDRGDRPASPGASPRIRTSNSSVCARPAPGG